MKLLKEHRHFLKLFGQTDSAQRKALLRTITPGQIKALSEIAHNIIKFRIVLTPSEKVLLRRSRRHGRLMQVLLYNEMSHTKN